MSLKTCVDCGARVNSRARRCSECKRIFRAKNAREKYHSASTRVPDDSHEAPAGLGGEVVDYSQGGDPLAGMRPVASYRPHHNHDHNTRVRKQRDAEQSEDNSMSDWDRVVANQADYGILVAFEAPSWSPAASGVSGFYLSTEARPVDFSDVAGQAFRPRVEPDNGRRGHLVRDLMPWR